MTSLDVERLCLRTELALKEPGEQRKSVRPWRASINRRNRYIEQSLELVLEAHGSANPQEASSVRELATATATPEPRALYAAWPANM